MADSYQTIKDIGTYILKEKSSKFIGIAVPVYSEEEVRIEIEKLKSEHHAARHWCYAYRLGETGDRFRSYDDGEPGHSAGDPILRQIDSRELTNVLVVVVRYYGGVKLGVGGLIQAYGGAASSALDEAKTIEVKVEERLKVSFGYEDMSDVMRIIKKYHASMDSHEFATTCWVELSIERERYQQLFEELSMLHRIEIVNRSNLEQ